jgi:hypothetical protein
LNWIASNVRTLAGVGDAQYAPIGSGWSGRQPPGNIRRPDECDTLAFLRASAFLMRDPAKRRIWAILAALVFLVVSTFIADRLMNQ